jgi:RHS repeat-associated protein
VSVRPRASGRAHYNYFRDLDPATGRCVTQTSPDTGLTTNTYDTGGNLKTSTDARNAITTYTYDVMNRVATAAFKIGSTTDQTITYTYDAGTNGKGRLTSATDANQSLSWTYDAQGRVVGKGQSLPGVTPALSLSVGYGYNAQGQLFHVVLPSGKAITYGYNSNGQVSSVTLDGSPSTTILNNITYDPFGPITGWTWGNGTASTSRTFDTDGKLTAISSTTPVGNVALGYDYAFRITSTTDSGGSAWTLGYDLLDRLNSATKTGTTIGYTYDANGNRLSQTGTTASTYTVSGTSNRLTSTTGGLVRTYTYNNSGSALTSGVATYTYYNSGRMKTGKLGSAGATTYIFNALGQRVKKSGGAVTAPVYFMYDEAGHLVGEYTVVSGVASRVQETVWLGDIPVATLRTNGANVDVFYVHTDQLNTPRKVTNTANQLRWKWDPNPFGEGSLPVENPNPPNLGVFKYNLRFPGQYFDLETNLNYNYFRDYDPAVGRYVESDPIGLKGGVNTYAYVEGSPVDSIDPEGLVKFRWRTCNAAEVDFCKSYCAGVIGRPYQSCRARVGFRLNIDTTDYYTLPKGLSCSCQPPLEDLVPVPTAVCGQNCKPAMARLGAGLLAYVVVKKCIGAGLLATPAAPVGVVLLATP